MATDAFPERGGSCWDDSNHSERNDERVEHEAARKLF